MPAATAQAFINNYKTNTVNFFAYGYLLDISKTKTMSPTAVRVYNGITSDTLQKMVVVPLTSAFKVNTAQMCMMQSDDRLCPKLCDIVSESAGVMVSGAEASSTVNACMECLRYETANALVVFTPTLTALATAGFNYVRIYNGMDATSKRYVVYVPVDGQGREVITPNMFVGDYSSVLMNCKYP
jgi:hypothetical protein